MQDETVELEEGTGIEQQLDPLASGQLAFGVLTFDALASAPFETALPKRFEVSDPLLESQSTIPRCSASLRRMRRNSSWPSTRPGRNFVPGRFEHPPRFLVERALLLGLLGERRENRLAKGSRRFFVEELPAGDAAGRANGQKFLLGVGQAHWTHVITDGLDHA